MYTSLQGGVRRRYPVVRTYDTYIPLHSKQHQVLVLYALCIFALKPRCHARVCQRIVHLHPPFGCILVARSTPQHPSLPCRASLRTMCVHVYCLAACWLTCVYFSRHACLHLPYAFLFIISAFKATSCAATSATSAPCSRSSC